MTDSRTKYFDPGVFPRINDAAARIAKYWAAAQNPENDEAVDAYNDAVAALGTAYTQWNEEDSSRLENMGYEEHQCAYQTLALRPVEWAVVKAIFETSVDDERTRLVVTLAQMTLAHVEWSGFASGTIMFSSGPCTAFLSGRDFKVWEARERKGDPAFSRVVELMMALR